MKYTIDITINKPIDQVAALFDDPRNLKAWQPGLLSMEHTGGNPGTPGATSRLHYQMGKRDIEMIETIVHRKPPHEFAATYYTPGVKNFQENRFEPVEPGKTKWTSVNEFKFGGFMKFLGWFMPGAFKKQTRSFMEDFKSFAEKQ